MKVTLETSRLKLRPFELTDAEEMYNGWTSDDEVTKYLTWPTHQSIDMTKMLLERWVQEYEKPERLNFAIELKEDGKLIGGIDVVGYLDGVPVIGYNLARKYWNKGYMTEACTCLLNYLHSLGYKEIRIDAAAENIGSNRVIQKCGGVFIGAEMDEWPKKNLKLLVNRYVIKFDD